jgi:predicted N-acyltransferase
MRARFLDNINEVSPEQWNRLAGTDYPFLRHEFLAALEISGCTGESTGWQPQHLLIEQDNRPVALLPCYLKTHSWGEYVFDWAWADAYRRYGYVYYPKLVAAVPFTPATGPRLCIDPAAEPDKITAEACMALRTRAEELDASSFHLLFPEQSQSEAFTRAGLMQRTGVQYHWFNKGYGDFDDFLAALSSRKRKNIRREREKVRAQGIRFKTLQGSAISAESWDVFLGFYQSTYAKRSGHGGYLNREFFKTIATTLAEHLVMIVAYSEDRPIAGALCFKDKESLYGRYWGCAQEIEHLHFETCYYQGIDYCIRNGLQRFDSGAQGEHKIQRGFEPVKTWSNHWLAHPEFGAAVDDFLRRESRGIEGYLEEAKAKLPYKANPSA